MDTRFSLCIAGIRFAVSAPLPVCFDADDDIYGPFLSAGSPVPARKGDIQTRFTPAARLSVGSAARKVFQADEAWTIYRNGTERLISFPNRDPAWIAMLKERRCVLVRCGPRLMRRKDGKKVVGNPLRYPLDMLLMMHVLANRGGLILHACGAIHNGRAVVFLGKSGAGKSTLSRLLDRTGSFSMLSDDRVVVRRRAGHFVACGTPWSGDAGMALNQCAPLAAVFVLAQAARDRITKLTTSQALDAMLQTASIPWYDSGLLPGALRVCDRVVSGVPFFRLSFRPTPAVAGLVAAHITRL